MRATVASAALILLATAAVPSIGEAEPEASRANMDIRRAIASAAPDFAGLEVQAYDPPKPAPAFSLPDLDGRTWNLGDFRGKVLMLFFWATW